MASDTVELISVSCPICKGLPSEDTLLHEATFDERALEDAFSSARAIKSKRQRIHFRMMQCRRCGLVRSNPVIPQERISELYEDSEVGYGDQISFLQETYRTCLRRLEQHSVQKGRLLEIGCGNGFFLDVAMQEGYAEVVGVEPSRDARKTASPAARDRIVSDFFRRDLFPQSSFDVVCLFHILDHIGDPLTFLQDCQRVLKPGGLLLCVHHNVQGLSVRLFGGNSPIFNAQHMQLFSIPTTKRILSEAGFDLLSAGSLANTFTLQYCLEALPFGKAPLLAMARAMGLSSLPVRLRAGNLQAIARKDHSGDKGYIVSGCGIHI